MGAIKNIIEPGGTTIISAIRSLLTLFPAIVVLLTLGALLNYHPTLRTPSRSSSPLLRPRSTTIPWSVPDPPWVRSLLPDNSRFEYYPSSRFLATFPFLIEILYWNVTYWVLLFMKSTKALRLTILHRYTNSLERFLLQRSLVTRLYGILQGLTRCLY
jgi:hypothetical protein